MKYSVFILGDYRDAINYKFFLKQKDKFQIIGAIVYSNEDKDYLLNNGVPEVKTLEEIRSIKHIDNFSFEAIKKYRAIQRDIEFGMSRCLNSNMIIANQYYNFLFYLINFFSNNNVECVFSTKIPHGFLEETTLLQFALTNNIPTYFSYDTAYGYSFIQCYNNRKNLLNTHMKCSKMADIPLSHLFLDDKKTISYSEKIKNEFFKRYGKIGGKIRYLFYRAFGFLSLRIVFCLLRKTKKIDVGFFYKNDLVDEIFSFYKLKQMKKFYTKNSIEPKENEKYVFYAIHFEPEAATSIVCDLQNQLTIIQILSNSLPQDWKLYIKEHPHQYGLNNPLDYYFIPRIETFKDIDFYEKCLKFSNVKLINYEIPSKSLIQNAQAIATINGSIILESIFMNKPCITFDNGIMPSTQTNLFPNIKVFRNTRELQILFEEISNISYLDKHEKESRLKELACFYFLHNESKTSKYAIEAIYDNLINRGYQ